VPLVNSDCREGVTVYALSSLVDATREIAVSFWRGGAYEEARAVVAEALRASGELNPLEVVSLNLIWALVEQSDGEQEKAVRLLLDVWPFVDACHDDGLEGKCYLALAYSYRRLGRRDGAIDALTGACVCHERAGAVQLLLEAQNNLGNLLVDAGRFDDAHALFDKALAGCADLYSRAQFLESKAAAFTSEGRLSEALPYALESVGILKNGERESLLRESLRTLARLCEALEREFKLAEERPRIEAALRASNGHVTTAARILDMKLGTLQWKLDNQYPDLLPLRKNKLKPRGIHAPKPTKKPRGMK
jgi:tetratricopeptide (TPR) repeat protein